MEESAVLVQCIMCKQVRRESSEWSWITPKWVPLPKKKSVTRAVSRTRCSCQDSYHHLAANWVQLSRHHRESSVLPSSHSQRPTPLATCHVACPTAPVAAYMQHTCSIHAYIRSPRRARFTFTRCTNLVPFRPLPYTRCAIRALALIKSSYHKGIEKCLALKHPVHPDSTPIMKSQVRNGDHSSIQQCASSRASAPRRAVYYRSGILQSWCQLVRRGPGGGKWRLAAARNT